MTYYIPEIATMTESKWRYHNRRHVSQRGDLCRGDCDAANAASNFAFEWCIERAGGIGKMKGRSRKVFDRISTLSTSSNYWIIAFQFVLHMKSCRHEFGLDISTVLLVVAQSFRVNLDFPEKIMHAVRERKRNEGRKGRSDT